MFIESIHWSDYLMILLYLIAIFYIAYLSSKTVEKFSKSHDVSSIDEKYMAGKSLTFTETFCSIIATEVSALTFLGVPAFAYRGNFSFLQIYMGAIFGRFVIAKFFLPKIYDNGLTVYETMYQRGGTLDGRKLTASFFFISKILSVGVRLFSGSILISQFFSVNIYWAIGIIATLTCIYTLVGGLKAVVQTDIAQMCLFIIGGIVGHFLIVKVSGSSWSDLMLMAHQNQKTVIFDFAHPNGFFIGVLGGFLFDMATHGVDQDFVQRLTANQSLKKAQLAIFLSSFMSIAVGFLFLGIGALLWSFYQTHPAPEGVMPDQLFAHFITNYFPSPFKGLMVAAVIAATMSTLDSVINALSSCFWNDIWPNRDLKKLEKFYKFDNMLITALLIIVAFIASKSDKLLELGLTIQSWTAGSLLALFFVKILLRKYIQVPLNVKTVLFGYGFGTLGVALNTFLIKWDWQLNVYFGFTFAIASLFVLSKLSQSDENT
jgi:SSS family solute:Na+ symporter